MNWIELNWIELNWIEFNLIQTGQCFFQSLCQNALSWILTLRHLRTIKHFKAQSEFYASPLPSKWTQEGPSSSQLIPALRSQTHSRRAGISGRCPGNPGWERAWERDSEAEEERRGSAVWSRYTPPVDCPHASVARNSRNAAEKCLEFLMGIWSSSQLERKSCLWGTSRACLSPLAALKHICSG